MVPSVTVLLPAYNAAPWIGGALDTILGQTLHDLELVVIDDGSTDGTSEVLAQYSDRRLVIVRNKANEGLVASLNHGIEIARGKYVARMDADDIAHRRRLELQTKFLEARPEVGICGSWFRLSGARWRTTVRTPVEDGDISARLFFRSPFAHPTIVFRAEFLRQTGIRYDPASADAEDFDLWVRARRYTHFGNVPRVLLYYRVHGAQTSKRSVESQSKTAVRIRLQQLAELLPTATDGEKALHLAVSAPDAFTTKEELVRARCWLEFLGTVNTERRLFNADSFARALAHTWMYCCLRAAMAPRHVVPVYLSARFAPMARATLQDKLVTISKLFVRPLVQ